MMHNLMSHATSLKGITLCCFNYEGINITHCADETGRWTPVHITRGCRALLSFICFVFLGVTIICPLTNQPFQAKPKLLCY